MRKIKNNFFYKINHKDIDEKNYKKIASQIINNENYQVFRNINKLFWTKMIIKIVFALILFLIFLITLINGKEMWRKTQEAYFSFLALIFIFDFITKLLLVFFLEMRIFYFKARYIISNKEGFFSTKEFLDLKEGSFDSQNFSFENSEKKFFSLRNYKIQMFYNKLQTILSIFFLLFIIPIFVFLFIY